MKINIVARPDHSLLLYKQLSRRLLRGEVRLFTFYSFREGGWLNQLFPKRKTAPADSFVMVFYTVLVRVSNRLSRLLGYNRRAFERDLFPLVAPRKKIEQCEVLHYWPFYSINVARRFKFGGGVTVAEFYEAESNFVNSIYESEYSKYNLGSYVPSNTLIDQNEAFDFETDVIVGSEYTKRSYSAVSRNADIHVCNYGALGYELVSNVKDLIKTRMIRDRIRLVFVGQVCVEKGVPYLLEAVQELGVDLDLIGPIKSGQEPVFQPYIDAGNVNFIGKLPNSEVLARLGQYDLFCLPSLSDNYSLAVIEALSHGVPVFVTENCGNADDVIKFNLGFVVKIKDKASIVEGVRDFIEGFDHSSFESGVFEFFSDEQKNTYVDSVLEVYKKALGKRDGTK